MAASLPILGLVVASLFLCAAATELRQPEAEERAVEDVLRDILAKEQMLQEEVADLERVDETALVETQSAVDTISNAFNVRWFS